MCCDSCAYSDSEACQTSSEEEDSSWPLEVSDLWAVPDPWRRSDAVSGVHHAHVSDAPSVSEDQLCVSVLLREESLKGKTKREMCPSPLCRWQKRVWCWTTSRSSKPVKLDRQVIKTLKHEALWLCVVVCVVRECKSYLIYWVCLRWWFFVLCHLLYLCDSQYDNLPPSGD